MLKQFFFSNSRYKTLNIIEVSKKTLLSNFEYFSSVQKTSKVCPVLKGNAYGHGLKLVGKFVDSEIKPEFICVDSLYEAYELEKLGVKTKILIMGYTFPENFKLRKISFHLPVFDLDTLEILNKYQPGINVHIKIDTGMNRLGIKENKIEPFMKSLKKFNRVRVAGIYTHLSSADNPNDDSYTFKQILLFKKIIRFFEDNGFSFQYKHQNSTTGIIRFPDNEFNLSRVGLGFYGISPFPSGSLLDKRLHSNLKSAMKLTTHICQIKKIAKGETVSYGRTFKAKAKTNIAILPIGYYDGIDRRLSNSGKVQIANIYCPIIGRVCMNTVIIDISAVKKPYIGQEVIVYNDLAESANSIKKSADLIKTIPYELLANLSETTRRVLV